MLEEGTQPLIPITECVQKLKCKQWYDAKGRFRMSHPTMGMLETNHDEGIPTMSAEHTHALIDELEAYNLFHTKAKYCQTVVNMAKLNNFEILEKELDEMAASGPMAWILAQRRVEFLTQTKPQPDSIIIFSEEQITAEFLKNSIAIWSLQSDFVDNFHKNFIKFLKNSWSRWYPQLKFTLS